MIVWDEPKRAANLAKHGLDFADVTVAFFASAIVEPAKDGRSLAVGRIGSDSVAVIFQPLGSEAIAIISVRPASRYERRKLWDV